MWSVVRSWWADDAKTAIRFEIEKELMRHNFSFSPWDLQREFEKLLRQEVQEQVNKLLDKAMIEEMLKPENMQKLVQEAFERRAKELLSK